MPQEERAGILEGFSADRSNLIPILQAVQRAEGHLSPGALEGIARKLRISENEVHGVASFYAQFRFHPPGDHHVHVCMGTACHVRGGEQILNTLEHRLGIRAGQTTPDRRYDLNRVACLGCCALAPVVKIDDAVHSQLTVLELRRIMDGYDQA